MVWIPVQRETWIVNKLKWPQSCIGRVWQMTLPRLSNILWMVLSLASTITRLSSNIRTFMDSHLEDIHSGWSTKHKTVVKATVLYGTVQCVWNRKDQNLGLTIRNQWCWRFHNCPTSLFEHFNLAREPKRNKCCYSGSHEAHMRHALRLNATQRKQTSATLTSETAHWNKIQKYCDWLVFMRCCFTVTTAEWPPFLTFQMICECRHSCTWWHGRSGFESTSPGPMILKVASMCIGLGSLNERMWML